MLKSVRVEEGSGSSVKSGSQWWRLPSKTPWDGVGTELDSCGQGSGVVD